MEGPTCDKCGQLVPMGNDAVYITSLAYAEPMANLFYRSRHFLPVEGCEGSPSRGQYIEGQSRDGRGYPYVESEEARWRCAYAAAQRPPQPLS